jgi:thioredoxin 1
MSGSNGKTLTLTEATFDTEVLQSSLPVLVDFWAPWCGPCRAVGPAVEQLASEFEGRARVGQVNIDDEPGLAERFDVQSIPLLLFFRGGEVVDQVLGAVPKQVLSDKLRGLVGQA